MPFAVELFFDPVGEALVRGIWDEFGVIGASSMRECGARPHISLSVADDVDPEKARDLIDRFAAVTKPFQVTFCAVGTFPGERLTVFLAPVSTSGLLSLHAEFCAAFPSVARNVWAYYEPSCWVPHCTVATDVSSLRLEEAVAISALRALPFSCEIKEIGIVQFPPSNHLHAAPLTGTGAVA